jgi:hypothetical protein
MKDELIYLLAGIGIGIAIYLVLKKVSSQSTYTEIVRDEQGRIIQIYETTRPSGSNIIESPREVSNI